MRLLLTIGMVVVALALCACDKGTDSESKAAGGDAPITAAARELETTPAADPAEQTSTADSTNRIIAELAPEFNLAYDAAGNMLTGEGFPEQGISTTVIVEKVEKNLASQGLVTDELRTAEVRTILSQLAAAGQSSASKGSGGMPSSGNAANDNSPDTTGNTETEAKPPSLNYHPTPEEMMFPVIVFGDWQSIREDHANTTVEHNNKYFESIQFRYQDNAFFSMFRDGKVISRNEFPYTYEPSTGTVTLYTPDHRPLQTLTVTATDPDPYLIWVQREGSKKKTLYEKMGRGGEPVTLEDEIEGVRILKGDEAAEEYRRQKEKERREQSGG